MCYSSTLHVYVFSSGSGGSMRACHAAGPGLIPGWDEFPGWGFFGVFPPSPVRQMSGSFMPPRSLNIIWPSLSSSIIIHYGHQWPEMLMHPKTLNIQTYVFPNCKFLRKCKVFDKFNISFNLVTIISIAKK